MKDVGDACICRKSRREHGDERIGAQTVDRKLDLLVRELKRYGVSVAGIQETKWFGNDLWVADGYTLLHSGDLCLVKVTERLGMKEWGLYWIQKPQQHGRKQGRSGKQ